MTAYKVLSRGMASCHGGRKQWTPGKRHSVRGELVPYENGLHICRDELDLLSWLGAVICPVIDHSNEHVDADNKRVVRWCVIGEPIPWWNERTARHFACDCAEYALRYADDSQAELLQACIDIARAYADWPEEWGLERADAWADAWADAVAAAEAAASVAAAGAAASVAAAGAAASVAAAGAAADGAAAVAGAAGAAAGAAADGAAVWVAARADLAAILATYLDGTNEWVTEGEGEDGRS